MVSQTVDALESENTKLKDEVQNHEEKYEEQRQRSLEFARRLWDVPLEWLEAAKDKTKQK
jgi:hypothetical protein